MANKILNTPDVAGQVPAGNVIVGNGYTGNLSTFNGKLFVFDFENSTEPEPPEPVDTFYDCGSNTQTGAAELTQIPDD